MNLRAAAVGLLMGVRMWACPGNAQAEGNLLVAGSGGTTATGSEYGDDWMVALSSLALLRWKCLAAGAGGEVQSILVLNAAQVHAVAGLSADIGDVRIDALALLGIHGYFAWGRSLLSGDDPGTSQALAVGGG